MVLPASLDRFDGSSLIGTGIEKLEVAAGNKFFRVWNSFLIDMQGISIYHYFGNAQVVRIPTSIEMLEAFCFACRRDPIRVTLASDSRLSIMKRGAFGVCTQLKSICIPASVELIGPSCFLRCEKLGKVTFAWNSRLQIIGSSAFSECRALVSISIPASVMTLGHKCFEGDSGLRWVTFEMGSELERIESFAFAECSALMSLVIPAPVQSVGASCFENCTSMTNLKFAAGCWANPIARLKYASPLRPLAVRCTASRRHCLCSAAILLLSWLSILAFLILVIWIFVFA
jgi:hypothetical protein